MRAAGEWFKSSTLSENAVQGETKLQIAVIMRPLHATSSKFTLATPVISELTVLMDKANGIAVRIVRN